MSLTATWPPEKLIEAENVPVFCKKFPVNPVTGFVVIYSTPVISWGSPIVIVTNAHLPPAGFESEGIRESITISYGGSCPPCVSPTSTPSGVIEANLWEFVPTNIKFSGNIEVVTPATFHPSKIVGVAKSISGSTEVTPIWKSAKWL